MLLHGELPLSASSVQWSDHKKGEKTARAPTSSNHILARPRAYPAWSFQVGYRRAVRGALATAAAGRPSVGGCHPIPSFDVCEGVPRSGATFETNWKATFRRVR